jgi:hypothetical protein
MGQRAKDPLDNPLLAVLTDMLISNFRSVATACATSRRRGSVQLFMERSRNECPMATFVVLRAALFLTR